MGRGLTTKQRLFVKHYLDNGGNATNAVKAAGYDTEYPGRYGYRLLQSQRVRRELDLQIRKYWGPEDVTKDRIIGHLAKMAFSGSLDPVALKALEILGKNTGVLKTDEEALLDKGATIQLSYGLPERHNGNNPSGMIDVTPKEVEPDDSADFYSKEYWGVE